MWQMGLKSGSKPWRSWARALSVVMLVLGGCGGGGGGGDSPPPVSVLAFVAGNTDGPGIADGTGRAARFNSPFSVARDASGNAYVADTSSHTIRKITPAGVVTTFAGTAGRSGSSDGTGAAARFWNPLGVAVDGAGNVYVADSNNHTIRKITPAGVVTTLAGTPGWRGYANGTGAAAHFASPYGIAVDGSGTVYVADTLNYAIRKITPAGVVTTLAGTGGVAGDADGPGATAGFRYPTGVAVDAAGTVYVADAFNSYSVRRITPAGEVSTYAGAHGVAGATDGPAATARFMLPQGVAVDAAGSVYVTDYNTLRKISASGEVSTLAGMQNSRESADGTGAQARYLFITGVASDAAGNLLTVDQGGHTLRTVTPGGTVTTVTTVAGAPAYTGSTDGEGAAARFHRPTGLSADASGNLYVADFQNCVVRKLTPGGRVSTFAGTAGAWGYLDANGAAARLWCPYGVAADAGGNMYVADDTNSLIRKITPAGDVSTLAGSRLVVGSADGTGSAASFSNPRGVGMDPSGNVYVAETFSNTIRRVTPAGVVTTIAGTAGAPGTADGTGAAARFYYPTAVAADAAGNVYVADGGNYTVRKITAAGVVSTLAGTPRSPGSSDGTGPAARFYSLSGIAVAPNGNLYVSDSGGHTIRKLTPDGVVTTVVGRAMTPGFEPGPLPGLIVRPAGVAVQGNTLYIITSEGIASVTPLP